MKMKKKKIEKGISRIQFKHNNEIQAMELRIENHKNQLLREKANKMHEIDLKYKNKERKQKAEKELFAFLYHIDNENWKGKIPNNNLYYNTN